MYYYEVAPTKIFRASSDFLTYHHTGKLPPGTLVTIPLGQKSLPGLILRPVKKPSFPTKPIEKTLYEQPLPPHLLKSLLWLAKYYATPLPTVLQTALPRGIEKQRRGAKSSETLLSGACRRGAGPAPTSSRRAAPAPCEDRRARVPAPESNVSELFALNPAQTKAINQITSAQSNTVLLHGITGSGKTNIYLHLTAAQLAQQKSIIILTPEIALTSQLIQNFQQHFPASTITLLHSQQSESERHLLWQKILQSDTPQIIIGPRSALFAPVAHLGLIIIDEAHEPAYTQDQSPKYSALRLASTMGRTLLGTATPLLTDYYLAQKNHALITLNQLAVQSNKTAKIEIIDLKTRTNFKKHPLLSDQLILSIDSSLKNHTQSLLFHNRRGSAPLTLCDHCGWQAICPTCLLPTTLHADQFTLICHTCGRREKVPTSCPSCGNPGIIHKGFGTKHLEQELSKLFKGAKIARFDADTAPDSSMTNLYTSVKSGAVDIIIGTQMIAKGFDFPRLTTLGVVQADSQLSLPDFSSEERTHHLLNQVIGRANRGHQNTEIFIQTYQPDHPAITTAARSDFTTFSRHLLAERQKSHLPPFTFLLKLTLTYKTESATTKNIQKLKHDIENTIMGMFPLLSVSAPMPAFHEHTPTGYTWQLVLKSTSRQTLINLLKSLPKNPHLHTTLDPPTLL